jgi:hypothetical protein
MEQVSEIIKLWIHKESKLLCAKKAQSEQLDKHLPSFPVLNLITLDIPDRFIEKYYYPFRIALYYTKNLDQRAVVKDFFQSKLMGTQGETDISDREFSPIIHILQDENNDEREVFFEQTYLNRHPNVSRFRAIADSSIWNYFLTKDSDFDLFVDEIYENYQKCYYNLRVAEEYADLNARLTANAELYVNPLAPSTNGHAKDVSAFLFHSERKLLRKLQESDVQESIKNIKKYKWRFLLVDDHANEKMSSASEDLPTPTKLSIIESNLVKLLQLGPTEALKDIIQIDCVTTIDDAKKALEAKKYEIVLLDYLLGNRGNSTSEREYGFELLKSIKNTICPNNTIIENENERPFEFKMGPNNRLFFMFISAFTTAVNERLLSEGWLRSEPYWYIGEGACPVNTPYLFQYRLLHIMEKRMKDMGLSKMLYVNRNDFEKSYIKTNIIDVIYAHSDKNVRQSANEHFNDILSLLYNYKNLLVDTHNASNPFDSPESTLATALVMKNAYIGGLLEHLTQLVYLTAFGTVRQWPEMWEEYQFLKSVVGRIEVIEKYIFDLKNNSI